MVVKFSNASRQSFYNFATMSNANNSMYVATMELYVEGVVHPREPLLDCCKFNCTEWIQCPLMGGWSACEQLEKGPGMPDQLYMKHTITATCV